MQRKDIINHYNQLEKFIKLLRSLIIFFIGISFALYGLSAWMLLQGFGVAAFFIATSSYLMFTFVSKNSASIANFIFGVSGANKETSELIEDEMLNKTSKEFLDTLQKAMSIVKDQ